MREPKITESISFSGRAFSVEELELIREITADFAALGLTEISRTICELLGWKRANGRLKNHECRLFLEHLQKRGLVSLPALRRLGPRRPRIIRTTVRSDPQPGLRGSAGQFEPLRLELVQARPQGESRLWTESIERYHYFGYRVPVGPICATWCAQSAVESGCWLACCGPLRPGRWRCASTGSDGVSSSVDAISNISSTTVDF